MIEVYKHHDKAILPTRAHPNDAGLDLYLLEDIFISVMSTSTLATGISINIPEGWVGKIEDRSSLALDGLRTGGGVIDAGFNGEIKVIMHNLCNQGSYKDGEYGKQLKAGTKIAQFLIYKVSTENVVDVGHLWNSSRGSNGFGSTN